MNILELFNRCSDVASIQELEQNLTDIKTNKKGVSHVTFLTDHITANDLMKEGGSKMVGYIVWIPRDEARAILMGRPSPPAAAKVED